MSQGPLPVQPDKGKEEEGHFNLGLFKSSDKTALATKGENSLCLPHIDVRSRYWSYFMLQVSAGASTGLHPALLLHAVTKKPTQGVRNLTG